MAFGAASVLAGCSSGTPHDQAKPECPPAAQREGFTKVAFEDDFDSLESIDLHATSQESVKWYTDLPFGWGSGKPILSMPVPSVLRLQQTRDTLNWGISSISPLSGDGFSTAHCYAEARICFDPRHRNPKGWPSVWLFSAAHAIHNDRSPNSNWGEIDIFEFDQRAASNDGISTSIHLWSPRGEVTNGTSNRHRWGSSLAGWHTVGVLWTSGACRWYFDGQLLDTQLWGAAGTSPTPAASSSEHSFDAIDTPADLMALVLGSAPDWPLDIDWVRIWTR